MIWNHRLKGIEFKEDIVKWKTGVMILKVPFWMNDASIVTHVKRKAPWISGQVTVEDYDKESFAF